MDFIKEMSVEKVISENAGESIILNLTFTCYKTQINTRFS